MDHDEDIEPTVDLGFRIDNVPHKGKGLLATRPLRRGTLLFSEHPLFTQSAARMNSTILSALATRSREEQREFFSLSNAYKADGKVLPALAIFETNSLPCDDMPPPAPAAGRRGLFLTAARLNHSCAPNLSRTWDARAQAMAFRLLRHVKAGEELCVNYGDLLGTRDERRAELKERFRFECVCSVCVLEGPVLEESDRRRATIRRLYDEVGMCAKEPTLGMRKVTIALRLLKEEDLVQHEASFCFDAFQFCVLVSDFYNAKAWVRKAWKASCITSGPDSLSAHTFKMYWANPRAYHSAGTLPRTTLCSPE
ncbi:hypothetical protein AcW1_009652 [Taiwanofungus camphoratus]|nr:hypothetical protein AcW1_009652 [Antrodia cinnamomea]